ncbi:hypothetical protein [Asticcacaulis sp.]|uniref:hypothetical protein n=1 Tax=Asticcacaulis sp. TaxID=1872648 RepID=UPI0031DA1869
MAQYYQGQRATDPQGNSYVYDVKKGWQAATEAQTAAYKQGRAELDADRQAVRKYGNQMPLLRETAAMITGKTTGQKGKVDGGGIFNRWGWGPAFSADANTFDNKSKQLQIGNKPEAQDSQVTNFERELFAAGSPSLANYNSVNRDIIARRQAATAEANDRLAFKEAYLRRYGSLDGENDAWGSYVSAHPYYGPTQVKGRTGNVAYTLGRNPNQWRGFFGDDLKTPRAGPPKKGQANGSGPPKLQDPRVKQLYSKYGLD